MFDLYNDRIAVKVPKKLKTEVTDKAHSKGLTLSSYIRMVLTGIVTDEKKEDMKITSRP